MPGIAVLLKNELPFSFFYSKNIMPENGKIKILIKSKRLRDMAEAGKFIRED